eukprot:2890775-Alexandrium_andersonii.AAC.1
MRAVIRLADVRLAHSEPSDLLCLHLPTPGATDCDSDTPPTTEEALAPCCPGASSGSLASVAMCDSTR